MPFRFFPLGIPGLVLVQAPAVGDPRGRFREMYRRSDFVANGITPEFVQDNHSHSVRGVLRGLHYQLEPKAQGKLVAALRGTIVDVAVDVRRGSPTFRKWLAVELSEENGQMLYVPPGLAHGFCVLSEQVDVTYKVTAEYAPELERGFRWDDPEVGIVWPVQNPTLSTRDLQLPPLREAEFDFSYAG